MATIVLHCWGSYGDVNPSIALGLALRRRGHQPIIATNEAFRPAVEREGLGFRPTRPFLDPDTDPWVSAIMDPRHGPETLLREIMLPVVRGSFDDLTAAVAGADLLVSHPLSFAAPLIAERTGIRWVSTVLAPMSFFSRQDLPVLPAAPALKRLEWLGAWVGEVVVRLARRATERWVEPVRQLRRELGLPPAGHPLFEGQHAPHLVLALFPQVLAAPRPDWPPNVVVTGHARYTASHGSTLTPELESFLTGGTPPVVFTLGSSAVMRAGDFYEESAAAIQRLGGRAILLAGRGGVERLGARPAENIIVVDAAPHDQLFPRASAIVQQCGIGTLSTALHAGRPLLSVPFSHDQPDNAFRAERLGVSRTLPPNRYRSATVARELGILLNDGRYRLAAAEVGRRVQDEPGAEGAADQIERQLTST
jgi:UDP:flavonoid glycosyltransferase YjiC (YdhE family)